MNKIKSLFKASPIAMAVAGLAILVTVGVASAAIVSYISNAPKATVTVSSPVAMGIYEGPAVFDKTTGTYKTGDGETLSTHGGSSMPFTTTATNNANNRIGGYYVTVIEAKDSGDLMTGKEFATMEFNKNKGGGNVDITGALCVVKGDGTLMKLSDYIAGGYSNQKLIFFYDSDGNSTQEYTKDNVLIKESTGMCSALTPYIGNETRSVSHLEPKGTVPAIGESIEIWTFTPTWVTGLLGNFTISAQYVNDLASYAKTVYGL